MHLIGIGSYAASTRGLGQSEAPSIMMCPECSYFSDGSCLACVDGDPHPACNYCVAGVYKPPPKPWYKSDLFLTMIVLTTASVVSGLLVHRLDRWLISPRGKKAKKEAWSRLEEGTDIEP